MRPPLVFAVAAGLPLYLGFNDGGYDPAVRQEVAVAVWWTLALGLAFGLLPRSRPPAGARFTLAGVAALAAVVVTSLWWASSDVRSVEELTRLAGYAGVVALAWTCLGPRTWVAAAAGLTAAAVAICVVAVASRLASGIFPPSEVEAALATDRLLQPLGYWNGVAIWAAMAATMALAWSIDARDWRVRATLLAAMPLALVALYLTYSRGGLLGLAVGIALVAVLSHNRRRAVAHALTGLATAGAAILVVRARPAIADGTGTEGGFDVALAVVAAIAVCWAIGSTTRGSGWRQPSRRGRKADGGPGSGREPARPRRLVVAAVAAVGVTVAAVLIASSGPVLVGGSDPSVRAFADPSDRLASTAGARPDYWREALRAFVTQPVRGIGPGEFEFWWARNGEGTELVADAHSLYLGTLAELGVLGLAALLVALAGLGFAAIRGRAAVRRGHPGPANAMLAAAAVWAVGVGIDWTWELTAVTLLGIAAAAVAGSAGAQPVRRRTGGRTRRRATPWLAGAVVASVVAGAIQVPGIVSADRSRAADRQLALGNPIAAVEIADDAARAAPWDPSAYAVRAEAKARLGMLVEARDDARLAFEREPLAAEHSLRLADLEAALGDASAASAAFDQAVDLSPRSNRLLQPEVVELRERIERLSAGR